MHDKSLAASGTHEPADRPVQKPVPRRLVELDRGDRIGQGATLVVEVRDFAPLDDGSEGAAAASPKVAKGRNIAAR